jgi:hypothetical protein
MKGARGTKPAANQERKTNPAALTAGLTEQMQPICTCPKQLHHVAQLCDVCKQDYESWSMWLHVFRNAEALESHHMTPAEQEEAA